jgi:hypothetical protein
MGGAAISFDRTIDAGFVNIHYPDDGARLDLVIFPEMIRAHFAHPDDTDSCCFHKKPLLASSQIKLPAIPSKFKGMQADLLT